MALPGLSFEIVRTPAPVGIRADQTAIIALTERGPAETPTLITSADHFTDRFGAVMPGTLGALAAQGYYDNGGEQLIVTRFVPGEAVAAAGMLPVVGIDAAHWPPRAAVGTLSSGGAPMVYVLSNVLPPSMPCDVGTPVSIKVVGWAQPVAATITGVFAGGTVLTLATGQPVPAAPALPQSATLTLPGTVPITASGPGSFGNDVRVETTISLRRRAKGGLVPTSPAGTSFQMTGLSPAILPADLNVPARLVSTQTASGQTSTAVQWGYVSVVGPSGQSLAFVPGPAAPGFPLARSAVGTLQAGNASDTFVLTFTTLPVPAAGAGDVGWPIQVTVGTVSATGIIRAVASGGTSVTFQLFPVTGNPVGVPQTPPVPGFPPSSLPLFATAAMPVGTVAEIYDPTFTLTILEPARANVVVSGIDLRDLPGARALLAGTSVTIPPVPGEAVPVPGIPLPPPPELPLAAVAGLWGGVDGLSALPPDAVTASATIPVVGITVHTPPPLTFVLSLAAVAPGTAYNGISVTTALTVRRFTVGEIVAVDPDGTIHIHGLLPGDEGLPARIDPETTPPVTIWGKIAAPPAGSHHHRPVFVPPSPATIPGTLPEKTAIRIYEPTFSITVSQGGPPITVDGLDLRDIDAARDALAITKVTIPAGVADSMDVELPVEESVTLSGGSDGTPGGDRVALLAGSFQRCVDALEIVTDPTLLPDIVIAPDLWSSIWGTKGTTFLALDASTATSLADQMVFSAWRTSDRVVIMDPPLDGLQPFTPADLVTWRTQRFANLGPSAATGSLAGLSSAGTDFAAAFTPWCQIVAGGTYRGDDTLLVPPSAYVAGRMARTSRERGPWIATGNVSLEDIVGLDAALSIQDQETLQAAGLCPLRVELPVGATIQGVRSLSFPDRPPWGYLSTRRLFNFLRRALVPIGLSYVFESNTPATWTNLRRDLTRVLNDLFLRGGLAGSKASDSFYVKIDATNNPQTAIDAGVLTAEIGVAPAIPLEFLVVLLVVQENTASVTEAPP